MPSAPPRSRWHASLALLGSLVLWWRFGGTGPALLVALAAALALLAWCAPDRYAPIQRAFDRLTRALLAGLSWLLLGLVYFGVFTPLRLLRRDPLRLRRRAGDSFFCPLAPARPRHDRQF